MSEQPATSYDDYKHLLLSVSVSAQLLQSVPRESRASVNASDLLLLLLLLRCDTSHQCHAGPHHRPTDKRLRLFSLENTVECDANTAVTSSS